jgi:hypothetical protein
LPRNNFFSWQLDNLIRSPSSTFPFHSPFNAFIIFPPRHTTFWWKIDNGAGPVQRKEDFLSFVGNISQVIPQPFYLDYFPSVPRSEPPINTKMLNFILALFWIQGFDVCVLWGELKIKTIKVALIYNFYRFTVTHSYPKFDHLRRVFIV